MTPQVALRLLVNRRDVLGRARTETIGRLHKLLLELVPGEAKKFLSAPQARDLLNTVRPRDLVRIPMSVRCRWPGPAPRVCAATMVG